MRPNRRRQKSTDLPSVAVRRPKWPRPSPTSRATTKATCQWAGRPATGADRGGCAVAPACPPSCRDRRRPLGLWPLASFVVWSYGRPMSMNAKIRLYVDQPLGQGQSLGLDRDQAHYLFGVMRQAVGALVLVFNGRDGEWLAEVAEAGKRGGLLVCQSQTRPLQMPPDLWLLFAPIKKARTDFIVEKAAEMGAARIMPVQTDFTNSERIRQDRLQAHAIEAAEQCGSTYVPQE